MRKKLTDDQVTIILAHLEPLLDSCVSNYKALKGLHPSALDTTMQAQLAYWRNAASALRWAMSLAEQRRETEDDERGITIQYPRTDTQ